MTITTSGRRARSAPAHVDAVDVRQPEIQDHQIERPVRSDSRQRRLPVATPPDPVTRPDQRGLQRTPDGLVILDQQDVRHQRHPTTPPTVDVYVTPVHSGQERAIHELAPNVAASRASCAALTHGSQRNAYLPDGEHQHFELTVVVPIPANAGSPAARSPVVSANF